MFNRTRPNTWAMILACTGMSLGAMIGCQSSSASADARNPALTPGAVKGTIRIGQTTQTDLLETLGPPDIMTHRDSREVWTYDKTTYEFQKQSGYITVLFAGTGGDTVRSSSRSTLVMIYFDADGVVQDYRLNSVRY